MEVKVNKAKRKHSDLLEYFFFDSVREVKSARQFILKCKNVSQCSWDDRFYCFNITLKTNSVIKLRLGNYVMKQWNGYLDIIRPREFAKYYKKVKIKREFEKNINRSGY